MAMDINQAIAELEAYLAKFAALGVKPVEVQVRASGDDLDVIKVWCDLGPASVDLAAWMDACEAALKADVHGAQAFRVQVRAEKL